MGENMFPGDPSGDSTGTGTGAPAEGAAAEGQAPEPQPQENEQPPTLSPEDAAKEIEKWRNLARKHEDRAKGNAEAARELERVRREGMSEQDRAVREAVDAALVEARRGFGARLVDAEVRAAAAGIDGLDVDALLEGMNRERFLNDDGEPDTGEIRKWLNKISPKRRTTSPDMGQGQRGGTSKSKEDSFLDALNSAGSSSSPSLF